MFKMEPVVHADRERELVAMDLELNTADGPTLVRVARLEPVAAEDCDAALEWAERMEAAVDNFVSEVRMIQQRMEGARRADWQAVAAAAAARGERGAGAELGMEVDRG
jgi:hypothetical protein